MIGAATWGKLADRKGRRFGLLCMLLFTFIFGILSAAAPNVYVLIVSLSVNVYVLIVSLSVNVYVLIVSLSVFAAVVGVVVSRVTCCVCMCL